MLRRDANHRGGNTQDVTMVDKISITQGKTNKKNKNTKQDDKRKPKRAGEKRNRKYLHFFFNPFDHCTDLRKSF